MSRRMSCSMTIDAVRDQSKTVTRRHVDTWKTLKIGDRLTLIEKGMGLPKGAKQVIIAEVEIVDVRVEPIRSMLEFPAECAREGFPEMTPADFIVFWCEGHGVSLLRSPGEPPANPDVRRIEWKYLNR